MWVMYYIKSYKYIYVKKKKKRTHPLQELPFFDYSLIIPKELENSLYH